MTERCDFCKKNQDQVQKLVQGESASICDACINLCTKILIDEGIVDEEDYDEVTEYEDINPIELKELKVCIRYNRLIF